MSQIGKITQIRMSFDDDKLHSSLYIFSKKDLITTSIQIN